MACISPSHVPNARRRLFRVSRDAPVAFALLCAVSPGARTKRVRILPVVSGHHPSDSALSLLTRPLEPKTHAPLCEHRHRDLSAAPDRQHRDVPCVSARVFATLALPSVVCLGSRLNGIVVPDITVLLLPVALRRPIPVARLLLPLADGGAS